MCGIEFGGIETAATAHLHNLSVQPLRLLARQLHLRHHEAHAAEAEAVPELHGVGLRRVRAVAQNEARARVARKHLWRGDGEPAVRVGHEHLVRARVGHGDLRRLQQGALAGTQGCGDKAKEMSF